MRWTERTAVWSIYSCMTQKIYIAVWVKLSVKEADLTRLSFCLGLKHASTVILIYNEKMKLSSNLYMTHLEGLTQTSGPCSLFAPKQQQWHGVHTFSSRILLYIVSKRSAIFAPRRPYIGRLSTWSLKQIVGNPRACEISTFRSNVLL